MTVRRSSAARFAVLTLALTITALLATTLPSSKAAHADTPKAVVSLTFDDSDLDQYTNALPVLQAHGMQGTFYTLTGYIGINPGYMTLSDLQAVANAGNEIAGHTVLHPYLTQLTTDEATRKSARAAIPC